jgi:deoxyribodipyrimidine photolyase
MSSSTTRQHPPRHKAAYDRLEWDDDEELLDAWREGRTAIRSSTPAMRQLLHTAGCTTAAG